MLSLLFHLCLQEPLAEPQPYGYERPGRADDHLLPAWPDDANAPGGLYEHLVRSVLDLPGTNAFGGSDAGVTHAWGFRFPSFSPESGYAIVRGYDGGPYHVVGRRAEAMIWPTFDDVVGWEPDGAPASERYAAVGRIAGSASVARCEEPLDDRLAVRLIDESNARLARVRVGLRPSPRADVPSVAADGTTYAFGGIAFGRTTNGLQGPDTARLRALSDAILAYCFSPDAAPRTALEAAVAALEASEPG